MCELDFCDGSIRLNPIKPGYRDTGIAVENNIYVIFGIYDLRARASYYGSPTIHFGGNLNRIRRGGAVPGPHPLPTAGAFLPTLPEPWDPPLPCGFDGVDLPSKISI